MANCRWLGAAQAVAQVATVQITAYHASTTYKLTVNGKTVSTIAAGSVNATATALAAAWNASTDQEFAEVTASASTDTVTLTGDTAGVPFTATSSVSGGTGTIGSVTTSTAATGPNHWDNANNWSGGTVPANNDDVWIENTSTSIKYGLAQSAVTLTSLNVAASFTGDIGLPETNNASTAYHEYRARFLAIGATTCNLGYGPGQGSGRLNIDFGSVQTLCNVTASGNSPETDLEPIQLKGTHASNVVNIYGGSVALAGYGSDSMVIATLRVGTEDNGTPKVRGGAGLSLTTLSQLSGEVLLAAGGLTTVSVYGGTLTLLAGNVTTMTLDGGTVVYRGAGTLTTVTIGSGTTLDFSQDMRSRTITNLVNIYEGGSLYDPYGTVTLSNGFKTVRCELPSVAVDFGPNRTFTVA